MSPAETVQTTQAIALPGAAPRPDAPNVITIMQCGQGFHATKKHKPEGTDSYKVGTYFVFKSKALAGIHQLAVLVEHIAPKPSQFVIRGAYVGDGVEPPPGQGGQAGSRRRRRAAQWQRFRGGAAALGHVRHRRLRARRRRSGC